MPLSNGIMRLITRISKFSSCLHSVKIDFLSEAILSSGVVCFLQSAVTSVAATRLNKRPLFEICVVVAYFTSFKPERKSSCNLPW